MINKALSLALLLLSLLAFDRAPAAELTVDLHTHLFMNEGMTWLFKGDFDGPIAASSWKDLFSSQANPKTLDESGAGIVVVSLYANEAANWNLRDSIRAQIDQAERFVKSSKTWVIARNPTEARAALATGKRVLVLSLEGASGVLDSEEDLKEFIDERGVSIVTLLHLVDDRNGGVAFMNGFNMLSTPLAFLDQMFDRWDGDNGVRINHKGLTRRGEKLLRALLKRKVWIDLAHSSDKAQEAIIPVLMEAGQPLLYTHTSLRRYRRAERSISDAQLELVRQSHGIIGIVPSEDSLKGTPLDKRFCAEKCKRCSAGSVTALARHYAEMAAVIGADSVMLGTDFNGGMRHLNKACGTGTSLDKAGLWHEGQVAETWKAMRRSRAPLPSSLNAMVDRFLDAWDGVLRMKTASFKVDGDLSKEKPQSSKSVGLGMRSDKNANQLLVRVDLLKDRGTPSELTAEPVYYFLHFKADLAVASSDASVPLYKDVTFSLAGVRAEELDTSVRGEVVRMGYSSDYLIDQKHSLRISVGEGSASATLPWWRKKGAHDLFLKIVVNALGYRFVDHVQSVANYHGFYIGMAGLEAGLTLYPLQSFPVRLALGASIDASTRFVPGSLESDSSQYFSINAKWRRRLNFNLEGATKQSYDSGAGVSSRGRQLLGGLSVFF